MWVIRGVCAWGGGGGTRHNAGHACGWSQQDRCWASRAPCRRIAAAPAGHSRQRPPRRQPLPCLLRRCRAAAPLLRRLIVALPLGHAVRRAVDAVLQGALAGRVCSDGCRRGRGSGAEEGGWEGTGLPGPGPCRCCRHVEPMPQPWQHSAPAWNYGAYLLRPVQASTQLHPHHRARPRQPAHRAAPVPPASHARKVGESSAGLGTALAGPLTTNPKHAPGCTPGGPCPRPAQ
jgi:hypothetical protein